MNSLSQSLISSLVSKKLQLGTKAVENTIEMLEEGSTIPFISRYRKERTGSLDEVSIEMISIELIKFKELNKRKAYILKIIEEQGKLTNRLKDEIENSWDETHIEDLYLPFKKKIKTKATIAKENGLEPLAQTIIRQNEQNLFAFSSRFVKGKVLNKEDAMQGARYIIAEWISENKKSRDLLRSSFLKTAFIVSTVVKKKKEEANKYKDYFDFSERLNKIPSHRLLAIYRGEFEKLLRVKFQIEEEDVLGKIENYFINTRGECAKQIKLSIKDSYKRMLFPSIENEFRKSSKEKADQDAIDVFAENLKQLLLASPLGSKNIIGVDPGFRTGCKLAVLDKASNLVKYETIYPHPPQMKLEETTNLVTQLIDKYDIEAIAIGNGTAGKETMSLFKTIKSKAMPELYLVNESGASIYSASETARDEFPELDLTIRGAISIGRRLIDPLAELVKIDAKSIGVGQYQHDVNQVKLKSKLDQVVINCVNSVGINLNTASKHLLSYVSGVGPTMAQKIVDYRSEIGSFQSRKELLKVPRMGKKAYEQAAGFLRIKDGKDPLDNTGVHPERYKLVAKISSDLSVKPKDLIRNKTLLNSINLKTYVQDDIGLPTLNDILKELEKPGLDPRGSAKSFSFAEGLNNITDLQVGMVVPGIVNNLTKFGAFVDIGIKESGLLHISQIVDRFIKDPSEVLRLNQQLQVKITAIDIQRKRISLSLKEV